MAITGKCIIIGCDDEFIDRSRTRCRIYCDKHKGNIGRNLTLKDPKLYVELFAKHERRRKARMNKPAEKLNRCKFCGRKSDGDYCRPLHEQQSLRYNAESEIEKDYTGGHVPIEEQLL